MKTAERRSARGVRFVIALFVSAICMAVLGSGIARAGDLPPAWTTVNGGSAVYSTQNVTYDVSQSGWYDTGPGGTPAWAGMDFISSSIANFNALDVSEALSEYGGFNWGIDYGAALATAWYGVEIVAKDGAPAIPGGLVPVSVDAHGQGSVESGYGIFGGNEDFPGGSANLNINCDPCGAGTQQTFDVTRTAWMPPGAPEGVSMSAYAWAFNVASSPGVTDSSEVTVYLDPTITFDQAAFDTAHPGSGITLSDYYQIEYSDNLSPEPSTFTLFGIGLALAGYAGRRRKARA